MNRNGKKKFIISTIRSCLSIKQKIIKLRGDNKTSRSSMYVGSEWAFLINVVMIFFFSTNVEPFMQKALKLGCRFFCQTVSCHLK